MLKSSFKTAYRFLLKSKTFTFINIFGLAAGNFCCTLRWWMFGLSGLLALALALVTVSFHAIKAAISNPVNSLRGE